MKRRPRPPAAPPKIDMTPMIDCVFQLLIFFMFTLKIVAQEGNFDIYMPVAQAGSGASNQTLPEIKVRLVAAPDGSLAQLHLGQRILGNHPQVFSQLNAEILKLVGQPGSPIAKETEVELDTDYNLNYEYTIQAISACTGRTDPSTGQLIRYVDKIKFAPPRKSK